MTSLVEIKTCALNLLARREHSQYELRTKLKLRQFALEQIEAVLSELIASGLQSDVRYTASYIRMRTNKGYGPLRIGAELHERGVAAETISQNLDFADPIWQRQAAKAYQKKNGKKMHKNFSERAKVMRFLQYRGFTMEQIKFVEMSNY